MKNILVNGININYKEQGSGQDMILIHGKGYYKEGMDALFNYYSKSYHVISYDIRCHGKSQMTKDFSLDLCSKDLYELIKILNLKNVIVIGFSMGSYISLLTAEKYPKLFNKMILIGTKGKEEREIKEEFKNDIVYQAVSNYDLFKDINKIKIPVLVLTGENDNINPVNKGKEVANNLVNGKFYMINNAGHIAWLNNEKLVLDLIDHFLKE